MFKGIKNYFTQKKEIRTLTLDTIKKFNNVATTLSDLSDMVSSTVGTFDIDEIKNFIDNMNKIANDPELTSAYYSQVSEQAHKERMAEINKGK